MVVGRERVGSEANLADLVARRQSPAAKPVDLEHGARGAGHLGQHVGEFLGIVRQLVDLGLLERRGERIASTIVGRRRVVHDDFFLNASDLQRDGLIHRSAAERQLPFIRFESWKLDVEVDVTRGKRGRHREPAIVARKRHGLPGRRSHGDGGLGNTSAGFVDNDQPQLGLVVRVLR